ncbi:unnamed protein product [Ceratitis capitata]|uniref:(Mediterranean fruit fly) hypothetical protein n=1 Tax=Ceratitis capitata TaxID=7213 RepID=A0A811VE78_CERCA|nr:unnamed protein product [Ceratitis capitata]
MSHTQTFPSLRYENHLDSALSPSDIPWSLTNFGKTAVGHLPSCAGMMPSGTEDLKGLNEFSAQVKSSDGHSEGIFSYVCTTQHTLTENGNHNVNGASQLSSDQATNRPAESSCCQAAAKLMRGDAM